MRAPQVGGDTCRGGLLLSHIQCAAHHADRCWGGRLLWSLVKQALIHRPSHLLDPQAARFVHRTAPRHQPRLGGWLGDWSDPCRRRVESLVADPIATQDVIERCRLLARGLARLICRDMRKAQ